MNQVLTRILADKVEEVARAKAQVGLAALEAQIQTVSGVRGFAEALVRQAACNRPAIIAEMKRASPSRGVLRQDLDPVAIGQSYERAGATALSVLTDGPYFQGSAADLVAARSACRLPVLRKDFMVDPYQIAESRALGADCILLIVAALSAGQVMELFAAAQQYGLDALVEVHDARELERALRLPGGLIGINNRNLQTFVTSIDTTLGLVDKVPPERLVVTESGISTPVDVVRLKAAGLRGFLVGEAFMVAADPGARLAQLFEGWL
ncbi:MAG TPA: indole-3-glycerol phosphate synthase TrpC [Acidiferrobacter sp.]|nr:indole-3-glycerol phosphate synthase TrpC [Acidiferrobacter sp.]